MNAENEKVKQLLIIKSNLQTALETNNREDITRYFNEFKSLYEEITSKKFEDDIPEDKLRQIQSVINGNVEEGKDIKATDDEILM